MVLELFFCDLLESFWYKIVGVILNLPVQFL